MIKPAVGYCRVSTDDQAKEGVSLEAQQAKIRAYCQLHDLDLLDALMDEGISGSSMDRRPELRLALERVIAARGVLVVYSLSRLTRSVRDAIVITDLLRSEGCDFVSITESIDTTTASGKMFFHMIAAFAQFERDIAQERTVSAMGHKRNAGQFLGNAPYGFRAAPGSSPDAAAVLVPDPGEMVGLGIILKAMSEPTVRYADLARSLAAAGCHPRSGGSWDRGVVRQIVLFHRTAAGAILRSQHGLYIEGDTNKPEIAQ